MLIKVFNDVETKSFFLQFILFLLASYAIITADYTTLTIMVTESVKFFFSTPADEEDEDTHGRSENNLI